MYQLANYARGKRLDDVTKQFISAFGKQGGRMLHTMAEGTNTIRLYADKHVWLKTVISGGLTAIAAAGGLAFLAMGRMGLAMAACRQHLTARAPPSCGCVPHRRPPVERSRPEAPW